MNNLQNIPSVDELLTKKQINEYLRHYNRHFIVNIIRQATNQVRKELLNQTHNLDREQISELIIDKVDKLVQTKTSGTLQKVINGTGVVLHTNMGRAPLAKKAVEYMVEMAMNYNNLELDLDKGERGSRYVHVEQLLIELTGAEAALVVNNNAAAVMLGLNTLAQGKQVIVSRGQLVEIGGAFRIPEVMKLSGAKLVEVGTTNKTYISDFRQAITEETALLFTAHTSNYKIVGFTKEVRLEELVKLGAEFNLPVMHDLGSGMLYDYSSVGLDEESTIQKCIAAGADIVTFSGDKLLGGPQAGIIVGKKVYIDAMKKNQLTRALRVDKLTIAALEGTLIEYLSGDPQHNIPIVDMLTIPLNQLEERAKILYQLLVNGLTDIKPKKIDVIPVEDMVGGGAYPTHHIKGYGVEIDFGIYNVEDIAKCLRMSKPAMMVRLQDNKMLISVRTLLDHDLKQIPRLITLALNKQC